MRLTDQGIFLCRSCTCLSRTTIRRTSKAGTHSVITTATRVHGIVRVESRIPRFNHAFTHSTIVYKWIPPLNPYLSIYLSIYLHVDLHWNVPIIATVREKWWKMTKTRCHHQSCYRTTCGMWCYHLPVSWPRRRHDVAYLTYEFTHLTDLTRPAAYNLIKLQTNIILLCLIESWTITLTITITITLTHSWPPKSTQIE